VVPFPNFSDLQNVQNGYGNHPLYYSTMIGESFSQVIDAEA
jgi:hypothetical protein